VDVVQEDLLAAKTITLSVTRFDPAR